MDYRNAMFSVETSLDLFTLFAAGAGQQSSRTTSAQVSTIMIIMAAAGDPIVGMAVGLFIKGKRKGKWSEGAREGTAKSTYLIAAHEYSQTFFPEFEACSVNTRISPSI